MRIISRCGQCGKITLGTNEDWNYLKNGRLKFNLCPKCYGLYNKVAEGIVDVNRKTDQCQYCKNIFTPVCVECLGGKNQFEPEVDINAD